MYRSSPPLAPQGLFQAVTTYKRYEALIVTRAYQRKYLARPLSRRNRVRANEDLDQADASPQKTEHTLKYVMTLSSLAMEIPEPGEANALIKPPAIAAITYQIAISTRSSIRLFV